MYSWSDFLYITYLMVLIYYFSIINHYYILPESSYNGGTFWIWQLGFVRKTVPVVIVLANCNKLLLQTWLGTVLHVSLNTVSYVVCCSVTHCCSWTVVHCLSGTSLNTCSHFFSTDVVQTVSAFVSYLVVGTEAHFSMCFTEHSGL